MDNIEANDRSDDNGTRDGDAAEDEDGDAIYDLRFPPFQMVDVGEEFKFIDERWD